MYSHATFARFRLCLLEAISPEKLIDRDWHICIPKAGKMQASGGMMPMMGKTGGLKQQQQGGNPERKKLSNITNITNALKPVGANSKPPLKILDSGNSSSKTVKPRVPLRNITNENAVSGQFSPSNAPSKDLKQVCIPKYVCIIKTFYYRRKIQLYNILSWTCNFNSLGLSFGNWSFMVSHVLFNMQYSLAVHARRYCLNVSEEQPILVNWGLHLY